MQLNITEQNPLQIFVVDTTWDEGWNPNIDVHPINNYKEFMNTLEELTQEKLAHVILCKQGEHLFGYQQEADIDGWCGIYNAMSENDIKFWHKKIMGANRITVHQPIAA